VTLRSFIALAFCGLCCIGCGDDSASGLDGGAVGTSGASGHSGAAGTAAGVSGGMAGVGGPAAGSGGRGVVAGAAGSGAGGRSGASGSAGRDASAGRGVDAGPPDIENDAGEPTTEPTTDPHASPVNPSLACTPGETYGDPLPAQRTATLVMGDFDFIEGPVWVPSLGALFFSDLHFDTSGNPNGPDSQIRKYVPPNTFSVLVPQSGSNGLALGLDGKILAATHDVQSLSRFDPQSGAREMIDLRYQGKHFNSPNDLVQRSDGTIYFTDPDWQLGPRTSETGVRGLYRVAPSGEVSLVDGSLMNPNGVALSPDERTLYAGSQGQQVMKYALDAMGRPSAGQPFAMTGAADGLTVDCAGNLYVTANTVQVFSSAGMKLGDITVAELPSNVAFGGTARKTLFITAEAGLYKIELNIPSRAY